MPLVAHSLRTVLAAACLLTVAGCSGTKTTDGAVTFAPAHRKAAPDLSGTTIGKGAQFSLTAERGQVVVVNFWASWCDPCRDELQQLDAAAATFRPKGVTFIGVDFHGDNISNARAFLKGHQVPYDSLADPDSKTVLAFKGKVTIQAPPLTMVIDKQGRIAAVVDGIVTYSQLRDLVTAAVAEPA